MDAMMKKFNPASVNFTKISLAAIYLTGSSLSIVSLPHVATAQDGEIDCNLEREILLEECAHVNAGTTVVMPVGENEELETDGAGPIGQEGFSITIDGATFAGVNQNQRSRVDRSTVAGATRAFDDKRETDLVLKGADVQVSVNTLESRPILNISTVDGRVSFPAGTPVRFRTSSNYPAWVKRAELRLYKLDSPTRTRPLAVVPVELNTVSSPIALPSEGSGEFAYTLRVYDDKGRWDETRPRAINRTTKDFDRHATVGELNAAGEGEDNTDRRNIPVYGGTVTVYGYSVPSGGAAFVMGEPVIVDSKGDFVIQRILPPGEQAVSITLQGGGNNQQLFREVEIPASEWFYVGHGDLTIGARNDPDELRGEDGFYSHARAALYAKGRLKGNVIITAALDTDDEEISDILSNLDQKDPRAFLQRIDPDRYYTVYGDDSSLEENAPSLGKFYVKVERDDDHFLWGSFKADLDGSQFVRSERTLYGASVKYHSKSVTSFGEPKVQINAFAANPEHVSQRDVFRGTGTSFYFLKRQDISIGSETIAVEVRDASSGRVLSRRPLAYGEDYAIDYTQGLVILQQPLASTVGAGTGLVRGGALEGHEAHLVVTYEYAPTIDDVDAYTIGGRAQAWITDSIKFGVTALKEENEVGGSGLNDYEILAADATYRLSDNTFARIEIAESQGTLISSSTSTDGGLLITDGVEIGSAVRAQAISFEARADLQELFPTSSLNGSVGLYFKDMEAGFTSLDYAVTADTTLYGIYGDIELSSATRLGFDIEKLEEVGGVNSLEVSADLAFSLNPNLDLALGVKHIDKADPGGLPEDVGTRTDIAAKLTWKPSDDLSLYGFAQSTVSVSGGLPRNDRYGVGGDIRLSDKIRLNGEISDGTSGSSAQATLRYETSATDHFYIGYQLDPERDVTGATLNGRDNGTIIVGASRKFNEHIAGYSENSYDMFGEHRAITNTLGVSYTPDSQWTFTGALEYGEVTDPDPGYSDFERKALSLGAGYVRSQDFKAFGKLELREEDSQDDTRDRMTYGFSAGFNYKVDPNWRVLADLDYVSSKSDQDSVLDGKYAEFTVGAAYRPIDNDRLNMLFKYTYLYDLPGPDQLTVNGDAAGFKQKSHILTADVNYDLNEQFTLGAKYGYRMSEVAERDSDVFTSSTVHLGILRLDYHVVHNWDIMAEMRMMYSEESKQRDTGGVLAVYRHFNNNIKAGLGYNFGNFSDDLTDLSYNDSGVFMNIVAKF